MRRGLRFIRVPFNYYIYVKDAKRAIKGEVGMQNKESYLFDIMGFSILPFQNYYEGFGDWEGSFNF